MIKDIFEGEQSIYRSGTTEIPEILKRISGKYMSDHPYQTLGMRPYIDCGFKQRQDACFLFDFDKIYPDAKNGSYCYAMSYVEFETNDTRAIHMDARYWSELYIDGELIHQTTVDTEAIPKISRIVYNFKKGKTPIFIKARKNKVGFKAVFGEGLLANKPIRFSTPFAENEGSLGWLYTKPFDEDIYKTSEDFPSICDNQPDFWYPTQEKISQKADFGKSTGYVYAVSNLYNNTYSKNVVLKLESNKDCDIYIDGNKAFSGRNIEKALEIIPGLHYICAEISCIDNTDVKFNISATADGKNIDFVPFKCVRTNTPWLYMGALKEKCEILYKGLDINLLGETDEGYTYYRAGLTNNLMRPVREDLVYGAWTYPLGVVMYGLLETSKTLGDKRISDYAAEHILTSTRIHKYATWEKGVYGAAGINGTVVTLDMLDFCGSFGNAILYASEFTENNETMIDISHYISDYIKNKQERLDNGMFYRERPGTIHDNTIWADDLYMSVPFLCRYYKFTGNEEFLEDAINQFLCFKEYLYMPDKKLMAHVYNLVYDTNTGLPWGRGNGWTLFSFSELLKVLPDNHPKRDELLSFFKELCEGVLSHQDEYGMWHQLVNDPESYRETSCTAMFTCAFSRGVQNGWLDKRFADSAIKGWNGLCNHAIDSKGNVYGVCVASRYSFRPEYYKDELLWHTNDLHGIGIVMLAGVEVNRLINSL